MENMTVWETLSGIDVSKHVEKKNGFTYLSWAWAWTVLKQHYPSAQYVKHSYSVNGLTVPYMLDHNGDAYVCVTVKIPHNSSDILGHLAEATPDSFAVNASLQRCMVKAMALLGLGCYIYAGEDMPANSSGGPDSSGNKPVPRQTPELGVKETQAHQSALVTGSGASGLNKIKSPLALADEIAMAPDMDSLKTIYNRVSMGLSSEDKQLFSNRKKELMSNE
jgi:hypothetical protein